MKIGGAPVAGGIDVARGIGRVANGGEFIQKTPTTEANAPLADAAAKMLEFFSQAAAEQKKAAAELSASAKSITAATGPTRIAGSPE